MEGGGLYLGAFDQGSRPIRSYYGCTACHSKGAHIIDEKTKSLNIKKEKKENFSLRKLLHEQ